MLCLHAHEAKIVPLRLHMYLCGALLPTDTHSFSQAAHVQPTFIADVTDQEAVAMYLDN
jgi:hypothetical protein